MATFLQQPFSSILKQTPNDVILGLENKIAPVMHKIILSFLYLIPVLGFTQDTLSIMLDGKLNELFWEKSKSILKSDNLILKEDSANYYLAVRTKSSVMVNVLIKSENSLSILHSSMSIGKAVYSLNDSNGELKKGFSSEASSWDFRDPSLRKRKKSKQINVKDELELCLKNNGWAASTMKIGNDGETEFIIDKSLIPTGSSICILFGMMDLNVYPENSTITPSKSEDLKLHMSATPEHQEFNITNWVKF